MLLKFRFNAKAFGIFFLIFIVEIIIALFINDSIIRPYGGDVLVVMLMYYCVKSFFQIKLLYLAIATVLFAYMVELGQYLRLVEILNLQDNVIMRTVIGSSFSWGDIFAYTLGGIICYLIDRKKHVTTT
ncbi:MAG: DUF2809 domain-containing protein [Dysgonomonas sp.]|nr:DUF2809 domain-containing protein [Dysgonomonas sp.]